jgi:hypothetical protein
MWPGWLPIALSLRRKASTVTWLACGTVPCGGPFFMDTVRALRAAGGAREMQTPLETLCDAAAAIDPVPVTGFIFHVSRCGSTLIANAARAAAGAVVISEAEPLSYLFSPYRVGLWPYAAPEWEAARDRLLRATMRVYAQRRGGDERRLIVKFTSWNLLFLAVVRRLWPEVPALIVVRDPVEVLVAALAEPTMWMALKNCPVEASILFGWEMAEVRAMSPAEYGARAIGALCQAALAGLGGSCQVVDYRQIDTPALCRLSEWLNGTLTADDRHRVAEIAQVYSKDPRRRRRRVDDRDAKQRAATPAMREAVDRWARAPYELLTHHAEEMCDAARILDSGLQRDDCRPRPD